MLLPPAAAVRSTSFAQCPAFSTSPPPAAGCGFFRLWGHADFGGDAGAVADRLRDGVASVHGSGGAFCAVKRDGSAVAWGTKTDRLLRRRARTTR